jgi:hypothetical protein
VCGVLCKTLYQYYTRKSLEKKNQLRLSD